VATIVHASSLVREQSTLAGSEDKWKSNSI